METVGNLQADCYARELFIKRCFIMLAFHCTSYFSMIHEIIFDIFLDISILVLGFSQKTKQGNVIPVLVHFNVKEKTTRRNGTEGTFQEQQNQTELFTSQSRYKLIAL